MDDIPLPCLRHLLCSIKSAMPPEKSIEASPHRETHSARVSDERPSEPGAVRHRRLVLQQVDFDDHDPDLGPKLDMTPIWDRTWSLHMAHSCFRFHKARVDHVFFRHIHALLLNIIYILYITWTKGVSTHWHPCARCETTTTRCRRLPREGTCGKARRGHADGLRHGTEHVRNRPLNLKAGDCRGRAAPGTPVRASRLGWRV
jgi:hypothetical protein